MNIIEAIKTFPASIGELSILTGIPEYSLYDWKNGRANPKKESLQILTNFFKENSSKTKQDFQLMVAQKEFERQKEIERQQSVRPLGRKIEQPVNAIWDNVGVNSVQQSIPVSFTAQQEIEMRMICYNLAALMITSGKGNIDTDEDYQMEICVRRARKYYNLYFSEN